MPVNLKSMALSDQISGTSDAAPDTVYTASNGIAQINQATAYNSDASARDLYVYILASGVAAASAKPIAKYTIAAGATAILSELIGHNVPSGGSIQAYASTTNVVYLSISGFEKQ